MNNRRIGFSSSLFRIVFLVLIMVTGLCMTALADSREEVEGNDDFESATCFEPGDTISGSISDYDDQDFYQVTASEAGKLTLTFSHHYTNYSGDWDIYVYACENDNRKMLYNTQISLMDDESVSLPFVGMKENGTYYVQVLGYGSAIEGYPYEISSEFEASPYYEKEMNDDYNSATEMSLDQSYTGVLSSMEDQDCYKIIATANGKIDLSFQHTYDSEYGSWEASVYRYMDGAYKLLSYTDIDLQDGESVTLPFIGAVKDGIYYVVVKPNSSYVVEQEYQVSCAFTKSSYYEKEVNGSHSEANTIKLGKTYKGIIGQSSDNDYYKFVADANGKVAITFNHTYKDDSGSWVVRVYRYVDSKYKELEEYYIDLRDKEKYNLAYVGAVENATYYIQVVNNGYGVIGQEYSIKTSFTESDYYEKEVNDAWAQATSMRGNKTYSGNINRDEEYDVFKFIAPGNGKLTISFDHTSKDSWNSWDVYLYQYKDGSYNCLMDQEIELHEGKFTFDTLSVKSKAVYYIKVTGDRGTVGENYDIYAKFTLLPVKNLSATAKKTSITLSWEKNGPVDGYEIQRKSGDTYKKIKTTTSLTYKNSSLKSNKTYTYRVRSYKTFNGVKYYSTWKTISAKTKK